MPITRKLTPDELQHLEDQGQDTSTLKDQQFNIYTPDEMQQQQQTQQAEQAGIFKGGVLPTLKAHSGSIIGGGLGATRGGLLATGLLTALAPEVGIPAMVIAGLTGMGVGGVIGGKGGQAIQNKIVEPAIGMTPEQQQQEQQAAQTAQQVYPKTSMATDIIAGGLAGGGKLSLSNPINAVKGLAEMAANPLGTTSPVYKSAIQNIVTGGGLGTAVNAGVQLATTGTIDPKELGASALGGAFFSEPSSLGRRLNPEWKPTIKVQPETPSVGETIEPDGTSIADAQAYSKVASRMTDEVNEQNQQFIKKRDAAIQLQQQQYEMAVTKQQQQDQVARQWRQQNWLSKGEDGNPLIADSLVQKEYVKRNKINTKKVTLPEQRALAVQNNERLGDVPVDQMRQELYDSDAPQRDPVGWQQEQQQRQQAQDAQIKQMSDIQEAQRQQQLAQQQQMESQQRQQDFAKGQEEARIQQLQGAEQQRQEQVQPQNPPPQVEKPLTPNQQRILNVKKIQEQMAAGGLSEPREGGQLFQEATPGEQSIQMTPEEHQRLLGEASKAATEVGTIPGELKTPQGQQAKGVSYDPQEIGRRLIGIAKNSATSDTGYHELTHSMLRDLDRSSDPAHQQVAESIRSALGGEEPTAQRVGMKYQRTVEELADANMPKKVAQYFKDVWAATKMKMGKATPEDMETGLVSAMRRRHGAQDTTLDTAGVGKTTGALYQPIPDKDQQFKLTESALERIKDIPSKEGVPLSNALHKTYKTAQNLLGKWWNSSHEPTRNMTPEQIKHVDAVMYKEVNDKQFHRDELKTLEERKLYDTWRKNYADSFQQRKDWGEPVYDNGNPRPPQQDPFYHATTTEPKIANILKQNTDKPAIQKLSDDFIKHQVAHGFTEEAARQSLKEQIDTLRGSILTGEGTSSDIRYNANRKAQGIPLPDSWRRQNPLQNLEVYYRRSAHDLAFYHHIETDPKLMASLGYIKDPWNNPIHEPEVDNLAGNNAVRAVAGDLKGERLGQFERNAHALESIATIAMLGAPTEVHKTFSSVFKTIGEYADNPIESSRIITAGIKGAQEAWTNNFEKIRRTGYQVDDAKRASDFLDTHLTAAERLQGLAKAIRGVYTLGGLTEKFTKAYLHSVGEYLIPTKCAAAEGGNGQAARLLKSLDPDYMVGKKYEGDELQSMASEFANQIHGTKDARTLPPIMLHDNEISAFLKLSSWNIAQTNNFMRNVWNPARRGDYGPLVMSLFGSVLGGYVIKELREQITGKKSAIPSLEDLQSVEDAQGNKIGLMGNKGLLAYNAMAAASYAGFAGILSSVARYPFDIAYKNLPQGATFPLDELTTHVSQTLYNGMSALFNDPNANIIDISTHALKDLLVDNVQVARMTFNHMANAGVAPQAVQYQKELSDKMGQLRRFKMATPGMQYEWQGQGQGNPYMNLSQKEFKREQDVGKAIQEVGPLIQNIIKTYGNNPEVMFEKLKGLKQNSYESMPSIEDTPMAFIRYVRFLKNSQGDVAAGKAVQDYLQHKMINEVKAGMVP